MTASKFIRFDENDAPKTPNTNRDDVGSVEVARNVWVNFNDPQSS